MLPTTTCVLWVRLCSFPSLEMVQILTFLFKSPRAILYRFRLSCNEEEGWWGVRLGGMGCELCVDMEVISRPDGLSLRVPIEIG